MKLDHIGDYLTALPALRALRGNLPISPEQDAAVNGFVETEDFQAAFRAFLAKQKPVWRGR